MFSGFLGFLLILTCLFLIILVLLQRGRGGGLTGALGGTSQSAFGAKAGDTFTWITVGAASFWIILCMVIILTVNQRKDFGEGAGGGEATLSGDTDDDTTGSSDTDPSDTDPSDTEPSDTEPSATEPTKDGAETEPKAGDASSSDGN